MKALIPVWGLGLCQKFWLLTMKRVSGFCLRSLWPIKAIRITSYNVCYTKLLRWIEPLSDRELEILQLIAEGFSRQEIASQLVLSLNTVKTHARNIFSKMGVNNQMQAVGKARGLGLLEND